VLKSAAKAFLGFLPGGAAQAARRWNRHRKLRRALRDGFRYDCESFLAGSGLLRRDDHAASLEANLIRTYHKIEKGLALREPRPGFGRDVIEELLSESGLYLDRFGPTPTVARVIETIDAYVRFHRAAGMDTSWLTSSLERLRARVDAAMFAAGDQHGGTIEVSARAILEASHTDFAAFLAARHSIRHFRDEPVDLLLIEEAVRMAQRAPSVCNRESGTAFVVTDKERIREFLLFQNGNRGFGEQVAALLVVTSRMATFLTPSERYQPWIDGGLFAMTLVYALHSLGLGTCCLNWNVLPSTDRALKREAGIPRDHVVIMMVAVGHLPENLKVASSPRRPLDEVLRYL
jgi:nitroreductase